MRCAFFVAVPRRPWATISIGWSADKGGVDNCSSKMGVIPHRVTLAVGKNGLRSEENITDLDIPNNLRQI